MSLKFNPYGWSFLNFSIAVPKLAVEESNSSYYTYLPFSIMLNPIFLFYNSVTIPMVWFNSSVISLSIKFYSLLIWLN